MAGDSLKYCTALSKAYYIEGMTTFKHRKSSNKLTW